MGMKSCQNLFACFQKLSPTLLEASRRSSPPSKQITLSLSLSLSLSNLQKYPFALWTRLLPNSLICLSVSSRPGHFYADLSRHKSNNCHRDQICPDINLIIVIETAPENKRRAREHAQKKNKKKKHKHGVE